MKAFFLILILFSQFALSETRLEKHQKAAATLQKLNFFYKGKGMVISPNLINFYKFYRKIFPNINENVSFHTRWGLNVVNNELVGLFSEKYSNMDMGVLGCVACHSGKAAGVFIPGLGNKNIDVGQIGADAYRVQKVWSLYPGELRSRDFRPIHKQALKFTKKLSHPEISNLTQGLVSTALIRSWFYDVQNLEFPKPYKRGQVKVPHLWSYGLKRQSGSFWDGEGKGVLPGWAIAVELFAGQTPENVREYEPKIHQAEDVLGDLLPPKYPFTIAVEKVTKGKELFNQSCFKCHGGYEKDLENLPVFEHPKAIPLRVVKTDSDRLDTITDELYKLIDISPLSDLIQYQKQPEKSYVAPRLDGIWARFPYLHNASVPNIFELLSPPNKRSTIFSLKRAGEKDRFDEKKLGLTLNSEINALNQQAKKGDRAIYDTSRAGHSNQGHWFSSMESLTDDDRYAIIEYLKTL